MGLFQSIKSRLEGSSRRESTPVLTDQSWHKQSEHVADVCFDVGFTVRQCNFEIRNDPFSISGDRQFVQPSLALVESQFADTSWATSKVVWGAEHELIRHYEDVITYVGYAQIPCEPQSTGIYFGRHPIFHRQGKEITIIPGFSLSGYAMWDIARRFMRLEDGRLFFAGDQGCEIEIWAHGEEIYLHYCDPKSKEVFSNIRFSRTAFRTQVGEGQHRFERILKILRRELGRGYRC